MNTIGKILVILNFLFAILVGVFLVMDVALRTQWKDAYIALQREFNVLKDSRQSNSNIHQKIINDYKQKELETEQLKQRIRDHETQMEAQDANFKIKIAEYDLMLRNKDLTLTAAKEGNQRLTDEIALLKKSVNDREVLIVKLEADTKKYRIEAVNYKQLADARQTQNELLHEQIREFSAVIARLRAGANPDQVAITNPNAENPPPVKVKGTIQKVDGKDNNLIQISLGTDHGVNKNHTLDVYRMRPEPKYLGMIRILEAYHHSSVARLVVAGGNQANRSPLKEGDEVTSKLGRN